MPILRIRVSDRLDRRIDQVVEEQGFGSKAEFLRYAAINTFQEIDQPEPAPTRSVQNKPTYTKKPASLKNLPKAPTKTRSKIK